MIALRKTEVDFPETPPPFTPVVSLSAAQRWWKRPEARWFKDPLFAFILTRFFVLAGAYLPGLLGIQLYPGSSGDHMFIGPLAVLARWDSVWYTQIADEGYFYDPAQPEKSSVGFFPLYPIVVRFTSLLTGNSLSAGILVNNLSFLTALMVIYKLARLDMDESSTRRAVFYLAAFPGSFFFSAAYSEGLYLLVSSLAVLYARGERWYLAALFAGLSATSRLPGGLMWGVVGLEWLHSHGWTLRRAGQGEAWRNLVMAVRRHSLQVAIMIALMVFGVGLFMLYLSSTYGDPLLFQKVGSQGWYEMRFSLLRPLEVIVRDLRQSFSGSPPLHVVPGWAVVNIGTLIAVFALALPIGRRFRASYAIYVVAHLILPLFGYTHGMIRYTAVLFPVFMLLGLWGRYARLDKVVRLIFLPLLLLFTALFVNWVFVG